MNIFQIEERIKEKPTSPLCVRLASLYLTRGRIEEAMKLCFDAIERFPKYATNYIVLGRCYAALQDYEPAIICAEKSLSINQDSILPRKLLSYWRQLLLNEREQKSLDAFEKQYTNDSAIFLIDLFNKFETNHTQPVFQEAHVEEVRTDIRPTEEEVKDEIKPSDEIESFPIDHTTDQIIQETSPLEPVSLEILPEEVKDDIQPTEEIESPPINNPPTIISSTLAEIYIDQGEYAEAINIYKTLIKLKPNQKRLFEEKIKILENKLKGEA